MISIYRSLMTASLRVNPFCLQEEIIVTEDTELVNTILPSRMADWELWNLDCHRLKQEKKRNLALKVHSFNGIALSSLMPLNDWIVRAL